MYVPAAFAESDPSVLHAFIEQYSFGVLVSQVEGAPFATHLPFLLERTCGPWGCLSGHVARGNPQWREARGQTVLAIFSGPHTYVSPSWYEAEQVVPTWNYTAVHASGPIEILEDEASLRAIVERSVQVYEQPSPRPWSLDSSATYVQRLLGQIVGFRMPITRLEGKWKLSQNQPLERRVRVVRSLEVRDDANARAIAALMQAQLKRE